MDPQVLGKKYDKIAHWWQQRHQASQYGVAQVEKALGYAKAGGKALDVGCGAGGRFVRLLKEQDFSVTGLDVSAEMIKLAASQHPQERFFLQDICRWQSDEKFDFIIAWDSIFHLPLAMQKPVLSKLCRLLNKGGVLVYTFGNACGEETDTWHNDEFYYSSIGINDNMHCLMANNIKLLHLELDQYPERHVYAIAQKP